MTEAEWVVSNDPRAMLRLLTDARAAVTSGVRPHCRHLSDRKMRLFACACCRVGLASGVYEDGTEHRVKANIRDAEAAIEGGPWHPIMDDNPAMEAAAECDIACSLANGAGCDLGRPLAAALRCIAGTPLGPAPAARFSRLAIAYHLDDAVESLAHAAYDGRLPSGQLDAARLAVLSDALEDAGCTDADLLAHLRSPGPHVRGCWAVDLLTGRS